MEMGEWLQQPADTAALAFITTVHCALTLLRSYRSGKTARLTVLPSVVFTAMPWVLPARMWLIAGLAAQAAWFLACERWLPAPPAIAAAIAAPPPKPRPKTFQPLRVLATFAETAEIRTFRLERPEGFAFEAGQFVMVRVPVENAAIVRCYSITSAPETSGYLEISVRNQGMVSRLLHETLRAGATLEVNGPGGAFVYPHGDRPIVLLAGGIGITPLLSMLRHGLACEPRRSITLILSAKTEAHVPFRDELSVLKRRHPQFRLAVSLTAAPGDARFLEGRIGRSIIERVAEQPLQCVYMICGPEPMIDGLRDVLIEDMGVPAAQVHFEKFEAATSLTAEATTPRTRLTLRDRKRTIDVAEGQTVLDAIEGAGESIPSMCRVGVCGTCRMHLLAGNVSGDFDAIDAEEQAQGVILACVARPMTDCVMEA